MILSATKLKSSNQSVQWQVYISEEDLKECILLPTSYVAFGSLERNWTLNYFGSNKTFYLWPPYKLKKNTLQSIVAPEGKALAVR